MRRAGGCEEAEFLLCVVFFFQAEDGIRHYKVTGVQTCALPICCGHPMGPLTLLDFVGLDTTYYISQIMFDEFKERRFAAPPLLKRMVLAGWNGRKSGRGFYDHSDPGNPKAIKF